MSEKVIVFDTETTNVTEPEIIEAAWLELCEEGEPETYYERFFPEKDISLGAMATHHIILSDLVGRRYSKEFALPEVDYIIGHNIDFDWKAAGSPEVKRICTLALSRWLFPEIDSHSQSAMMYYLFEKDDARELCKNAHSAVADVRNCRLLFFRLKAELETRGVPVGTWEEIWQASEKARIPLVMSFGKHKGVAIKDVPPDYKRWLLNQPDIDPYLIQALRGKITKQEEYKS
jgi:exodeoxyribonuclease X